ncbi:LOW QUALITY PROTEIN: hypothetical protein Cgig2_017724 [Carnegiea gigantea]|uniref:Endonuclease/exonuclease/phosphatase domain-containing protein n=1 Tax=Carnegiea gigantea TaxID=171969 RepID=A0A9Q1GH24_9CARY|nr:LOW QUALITY PROTEIN: hypothetical protein Cgig2_017724 [Carnegiea gigantea]
METDLLQILVKASSTETQVVPPLEQTEHNVPAATREEGQGQEGGLIVPNKQEDVKNFLHKHGVKLVALLKTKVKKENIASRVFAGWQWHTDAEIVPKVRVCVPWQEATFQVHVVHVTDQLICYITKLADYTKAFLITFVHGLNTVARRLPLWEDLMRMAQNIQGPWCVIGDFNAVLHPGERIGGEDIQYGEVVDFSNYLEQCDR